jgi:cytochrome c oxidase subunit 2
MSTSPRTRPSSGSIIAGLIGIAVLIGLGVLLILNGPQVVRSFFPPDPVSSQGREINDLYTIVFLIAAVIFFVVEGLIIWTVIRYRRRPGDDELPPQTHGHNLAEVIWTVVPTIIVIFLFFVSWQTLNSVEAHAPAPDLKVKAVAGQFQWTFDYLPADGNADSKPVFSQSIATGEGGGLYLPAGQTTHLYLSSPDVIHAFYVPQFLFKRDVVPGITNEFDLKIDANTAGQTFRGQCAELCGTGHRIMLFEVHSLAPAEFQAWYEGKVAEANATPPPAPSGGTGPVVNVTAEGVKFLETAIQAPADTAFTIHFDNKDAGTPHDVDIVDAGGTKVVDNKEFNGREARDYPIKPLAAGGYTFLCSIHPTMTGTLTVQ